MADPKPNEAVIAWTLQVTAGPGAPVTETAKLGDCITLSDLAPGTTNFDAAMMSARLLGVQFLETYLVMMGAEAERSGSVVFPKDFRVSVNIERKKRWRNVK